VFRISIEATDMGRIGRKNEPVKPESGKPPSPPLPPPPDQDDDYEDGDICTPKQDRHGTDDEPL
jgi:hypothetical protein